MISEKKKYEYFSRQDWTGRVGLKSLANFVFWRTADERLLALLVPAEQDRFGESDSIGSRPREHADRSARIPALVAGPVMRPGMGALY